MPAMLHVTSPPMTGRDIATIQEKLTALGYAPGRIDGAHGPREARTTRLGGGKVNAIQGNTSIGNDSNGGQVMRRLRYLTRVNGFGRVTRR
jgi:hypothetical protein